VRLAELAAERLHLLERPEPGGAVPAEPARIVVDDQAEARQLGLERRDLVDLLLVLGDEDRHFRVVEDPPELLRDRVLVDGDRDAAEGLRGDLRPVEPRAVVADHRELVAALEAERGQPERQQANLVPVLPPRPGLPDPPVLLADRRPLAELRRVPEEESGQGRRIGGHRAPHRAAGRAGWPTFFSPR